ncbi:CinA domain-containing protein [Mycobacteroides abscessus subsp. abscessus]|nr:CinA domain-containing protein [Mycobacteroides abscessus subsp. abscessus]
MRLLRERGQSVATAESLTAGLISASLAEVPGASAVLRGGVVSYAAEVKEALLGVDPELIASRGTVDPDVARAMAPGLRRGLGDLRHRSGRAGAARRQARRHGVPGDRGPGGGRDGPRAAPDRGS